MAETGLCHEKPVFAMVPTSLNPLPLLTPSNPFHISVCYDCLYHPDLLSIFLYLITFSYLQQKGRIGVYSFR